jgi:hypothetical protein
MQMLLRAIKIISIILTVFLFASCKKRWIDYRNKYCGDFYFHVSETLNVSGQAPETSTYEYSGEVFYTRENERDQIEIKYSETNSSLFRLEKGGTLKLINTDLQSLSGGFQGKDSISYVYSYSYSPGAGGHQSVNAVRVD